MDKNSLAHTKWECKYHIVFAPKYRRKIIYKKLRADIGRILRGSLEPVRGSSAEGKFFDAPLGAGKEKRLIAAEQTTS